MRLQVFLSKAGVASRRSAKDIIQAGKVSVNGKVATEPSFWVDPENDLISVSGQKLILKKKIYILLNKPKGVTTTKKDPHASRIVMDLLPREFRHLNPVGRLDRDTTGLILMTNDGEMINRLTHPRFNVKKTYVVGLDRKLTQAHKKGIEKGIMLEGKSTLPCAITSTGPSGIGIILREGRKRQIRKMFSSAGYRVVTLKRTKEGCLELGTLPEGKWRFLDEQEVSALG